MSFIAPLASGHCAARVLWSRLWMYCYRSRFAHCGAHVVFDPINSSFTYESITLGDHVFIAAGAWFSSAKDAPIRIGSFVMFGPRVTILCGDHETRLHGIPMYLATDKLPGTSAGVTIQDDVWIGANATLLKGVTIGRGAVVAAGSVVTRSVAPHAVVAGVPAREVRKRFETIQLDSHVLACDQRMAQARER